MTYEVKVELKAQPHRYVVVQARTNDGKKVKCKTAEFRSKFSNTSKINV